MANDNTQKTLRVLVIEDETLIGILLEDMLIELGAAIVGPVTSLADALAAAGRDNFDVALVDMNLRGELAIDVVKLLADRGLPFALVSGSPDAGPDLGAMMMLNKPFTFRDIAAAVQQLSSARA